MPAFSDKRQSVDTVRLATPEEIRGALNGSPVARVDTSDVPDGNFKVIEEWAAAIFAQQGGMATRDDIGDVTLDIHSAKSSMGHSGANKYKKAAFVAAKRVIEDGVLIHKSSTEGMDSFYVSAPVAIDGNDNIVTVLIRRDVNLQRMYLHAVILKDYLLDQRVSGASVLPPERAGSKTDPRDIRRILRDALSVKESAPRNHSGQPINQSWHDAQPITAWDDFKRQMQDKLTDTKHIVAAIRKAGIAIRDTFDPYLQEILYHGRAAKRVADFAEQELKPLLVEMQMRGIGIQEMEDYLWAKHAGERNAQIAKVNPSMPDGGSGLTNAEASDILAGRTLKRI